MVFSIHFEINAQRRPARAEIGLPLELHIATRDWQRPLAASFVVKGDLSARGIDVFHRHVHHAARFRMDGQEDRIGLTPLFTQRLQHDLHDVIILLASPAQRVVKLARAIEFCGRDKFVLKPERIKEPAQHGVVVMTKAFELFEGVGHRCQRLLQVPRQHILLRQVAGHLAHAIQVIRKTDELGGNVADHLKRAPDHRGAQHLAKGADMRQP